MIKCIRSSLQTHDKILFSGWVGLERGAFGEVRRGVLGSSLCPP